MSARQVIAALASTTVVLLLSAAVVAAASPSPGTIGGDPRSSGQGPGLVGDPLFALVSVVTIGLVSILATLIYLRLTAKRDA